MASSTTPMELLEGLDLQRLVKLDGPQPPGRVIHILSQAAGALQEAHAIGLVDRDVKPTNIFLCDRGGVLDVAKVLDFGLAKHLNSDSDPGATRDGSIVGTRCISRRRRSSTPTALRLPVMFMR